MLQCEDFNGAVRQLHTAVVATRGDNKIPITTHYRQRIHMINNSSLRLECLDHGTVLCLEPMLLNIDPELRP